MSAETNDFEIDFKIIDSHAHPGFEQKDIESRPGNADLWIFDQDHPVNTTLFRNMAICLGIPDPGPITRADQIPDFNVDHWITFMDEIGLSHMGLQAMDTQSDPPRNWRWLVPYEYVKEEFLDKYPDRFWGIGGIRYKLGPEHSLEQVEKAKEFGFIGVKMFTPMEGYPHDREKCYPIYERCDKLGLHVELHTGVESCPGARFKYCDPMFINDIAKDFPHLPILQIHCGMVINPQLALWNCNLHANVYTDISGFHSRHNPKYAFNADLLKLMEEKIPTKVFFGSDFPVFLTAYKDILKWIKEQPLGAQFKRNLLRDNAERFFLKREFDNEVNTEYSRPACHSMISVDS